MTNSLVRRLQYYIRSIRLFQHAQIIFTRSCSQISSYFHTTVKFRLYIDMSSQGRTSMAIHYFLLSMFPVIDADCSAVISCCLTEPCRQQGEFLNIWLISVDGVSVFTAHYEEGPLQLGKAGAGDFRTLYSSP